MNEYIALHLAATRARHLQCIAARRRFTSRLRRSRRIPAGGRMCKQFGRNGQDRPAPQPHAEVAAQ
jgi:hypothetical protein